MLLTRPLVRDKENRQWSRKEGRGLVPFAKFTGSRHGRCRGLWRFGCFQANDIRRLKQLEAENARLKKLAAERDLEIEVMKEVAAKNWCRAPVSPQTAE